MKRARSHIGMSVRGFNVRVVSADLIRQGRRAG